LITGTIADAILEGGKASEPEMFGTNRHTQTVEAQAQLSREGTYVGGEVADVTTELADEDSEART
jgi:hypothetical protein